MELIELELSGFKSFAKKSLFRFDKGLTAIIGPNGSGKSNLAEAIRWVFGEQSIKSLRGKNASDIIFSGNETQQQSNKATVKLTFNNESKQLPINAPEVTISRTLSRSGDSEYLINGDAVRLLDVQQILAEAGLGTKSYTVISQGMVDRYLTATPRERKELFDEATGVKALHLKLSRSTKTLSRVDSKEQELRLLLQEIQPRLEVLRRQVKKYQEREKTKKTFELKQADWLHQKYYRAIKTRQEIKVSLESSILRSQKARHTRERAENELFKNVNSETAPLKQKQLLQKELLQAKQEYDNELIRFNQRNNSYKELKTSLQEVDEALKTAQKNLENMRKTVSKNDFFTSLPKLLSRCRQLLSNLKNDIIPSEEEINKLDQQLIETISYAQNKEEAVTATQSLIRKLEVPLQTVTRLQTIKNERETRLEEMPQLSTPDKTRVEQLQVELNQLSNGEEQNKNTLEDALRLARDEELMSERETGTIEAALEQANNDLAETEREITREKGSNFLSKIQHEPPLSSDQVEEGEVQRLANRLAVLGEIDPLVLKEYEETSKRFEYLQTQLEDIEETRKRTGKLISSLEKDIYNRFHKQFLVIQKLFNEYYIKLFDGGSAKLKIVETESIDENVGLVEGVEIDVSPPDKKSQHINLLSGGEKALTSLALLLAVIQIQTPPFIVLDEVDAALDEANTYRFGQILKELSAKTQCIVITHNRETMGQANVLHGITMNKSGVSETYSIKMEEVESDKEIQV